MFLFTSKPRESTLVIANKDTHVLPDLDDVAALRELERQRLKWGNFLSSRPRIWSEEWLWLNRLAPVDHGGPIKKRFMQMFNSKTKLRKRVKSLIRSGVPPELRGQVWYACSGAEAKRRNSPIADQYDEVLKRINTLDKTQIALDIEKDLLRTFPDKISIQNKELVDALRRLLLAYAIRNERVGYCQSMNYICALLLLHMEEEKAFWAFSALLEDIMPSDYYVPSLVGGRIDQQVFQSCIAAKLPKIHECFKMTSTVLEPIICPWFLCLYVNVLPLYTACRVWDCLFWEGSVVLFRIGLTLMKSKAIEITKATDFIGIYSVLKGSSLRTYTFELEVNPENLTADGESVENPVMSDTEFLIKSAFGYRWLRSVPKSKVDLLRVKFATLIKEEDNERKAKKEEFEEDFGKKAAQMSVDGETPSPSKPRKVKNRKSELMAM